MARSTPDPIVRSVGYGDISPQNSSEYIVSVIYMFFNLFLTAFVVGNMTLLVTQQYESIRVFRQKYKNLEKYMRLSRLPERLCDSLRDYMVSPRGEAILNVLSQSCIDWGRSYSRHRGKAPGWLALHYFYLFFVDFEVQRRERASRGHGGVSVGVQSPHPPLPVPTHHRPVVLLPSLVGCLYRRAVVLVDAGAFHAFD